METLSTLSQYSFCSSITPFRASPTNPRNTVAIVMLLLLITRAATTTTIPTAICNRVLLNISLQLLPLPSLLHLLTLLLNEFVSTTEMIIITDAIASLTD